jgi:hypothetical protein
VGTGLSGNGEGFSVGKWEYVRPWACRCVRRCAAERAALLHVREWLGVRTKTRAAAQLAVRARGVQWRVLRGTLGAL